MSTSKQIPKLSGIKKWIPLEEAARHLSILFDEKINVADVLQFSLEKQLTISVIFVNGVYATPCKFISYSDALFTVYKTYEQCLEKIAEHIPANDITAVIEKYTKEHPSESSLSFLPMAENSLFNFNDGFAIRSDDNLVSLFDSVYDLPLLAGERIVVERMFHELTGGPEVNLVNIDGSLVGDMEGDLFRIEERFNKEYLDKHKKDLPYNHPDNFFPAFELPDDSVIVVRPKALAKFIGKASQDGKSGDTLPQKTRTTWLRLITSLSLELKHNPKDKGMIDVITAITQRHGLDVSRSTIAKILREIKQEVDLP